MAGTNDHTHCAGSCSGVRQTLDELDFERGIWYAAQHNDIERVERLLKKGISVNAYDSAGYTALHYAARSGYVKMCQLLLHSGADVDPRTRAGQATPLHRAAYTGKEEVVSLLLSHKGNPKLQDADGKTALHRAAEGDNADICNLLVNADPELKSIADFKGKLAMFKLTNV